MNIELIAAHSVLAIILFLIINWIGGHSLNAGYIRMSVLVKADEAPAFNFIYRAFAPVVFITIFSAFFINFDLNWVAKDIYLVVIYYFIFRLLFNVATGRGRLLNWGVQISYWVTSIPISYYVYEKLILKNEYLFPTTKELGSALWIAIILFIYHTFNRIQLSNNGTKKRKEQYIRHRYENYSALYGGIINETSDTTRQKALIYSIMLYEAFNRPKIYRVIENILFYFGLSSTLGLMQVKTGRMISDRESVILGARKIVDDHLRAQIELQEDKSEFRTQTYWAIKRKVMRLYNKDDNYVEEVSSLYDVIVEMFYPEVKDDWTRELYSTAEELQNKRGQ